jgi:hypothetical protein
MRHYDPDLDDLALITPDPLPDSELLEVVPGLAETLRAEGWSPGPPAQLRAEALAADLEAAAEMSCEHCGRAGLGLAAFHLGRRYCAVLTCGRCGTEAEL